MKVFCRHKWSEFINGFNSSFRVCNKCEAYEIPYYDGFSAGWKHTTPEQHEKQLKILEDLFNY